MRLAKRGFISICMALMMTFVSAMPAFAAEAPVTPIVSNDIVVTSGNLQIVDASENDAVPYGSLSGYRSVNVKGSGTAEFVVDVNGSWSPWAGCTLKTSGFSSEATIEISVCYGSDVKCTRTLGPNSEVKNIAMLNVDPGGYTIKLNIKNNSNTGNITVWVY